MIEVCLCNLSTISEKKNYYFCVIVVDGYL